MRGLWMIILLFLFTTNSFAQTYFPFPDSNAVWRETAGQDHITFVTENHYSLFLYGDTIINANAYHKLYIYWSNTSSLIDTLNSTYYGALREDNKRIYFYPDTNYNHLHGPGAGSGYGFCYEWQSPNPNYSQDLLLYDFNVNVGDTVFYPHLDNSLMVISSIDSVLIQSQYRKRYHYNWQINTQPCGLYTSNYVDGIGDIDNGLMALFGYYFENYQYLRCYEDLQTTYSIYTPLQSCLPVAVQENINPFNINIYPNPVSSILSIEIKSSTSVKDLTLSLMDITGKTLFLSSLTNTVEEIDISSYQSGIYLLKLTSSDGYLKTEMISIQ